MNKKRLFAGLIATLIAMGSTAIACHYTTKKNVKQNNFENKQENTQKPSENINPEEKVKIINKTMYGIPSPFIDKENIKKDEKDKYFDPNGENATIEKYGLPPVLEEDKKILKYGIPNNPPLLKYAAPPFLNDPVGEPTVMPMYALPDPEIIKDQESSNTSEKNKNPWK